MEVSLDYDYFCNYGNDNNNDSKISNNSENSVNPSNDRIMPNDTNNSEQLIDSKSDETSFRPQFDNFRLFPQLPVVHSSQTKHDKESQTTLLPIWKGGLKADTHFSHDEDRNSNKSSPYINWNDLQLDAWKYTTTKNHPKVCCYCDTNPKQHNDLFACERKSSKRISPQRHQNRLDKNFNSLLTDQRTTPFSSYDERVCLPSIDTFQRKFLSHSPQRSRDKFLTTAAGVLCSNQARQKILKSDHIVTSSHVSNYSKAHPMESNCNKIVPLLEIDTGFRSSIFDKIRPARHKRTSEDKLEHSTTPYSLVRSDHNHRHLKQPSKQPLLCNPLDICIEDEDITQSSPNRFKGNPTSTTSTNSLSDHRQDRAKNPPLLYSKYQKILRRLKRLIMAMIPNKISSRLRTRNQKASFLYKSGVFASGSYTNQHSLSYFVKKLSKESRIDELRLWGALEILEKKFIEFRSTEECSQRFLPSVIFDRPADGIPDDDSSMSSQDYGVSTVKRSKWDDYDSSSSTDNKV